MKLIVVESPTKAKTLKKFLGRDYQITATFGHIRDLPKAEFGIDIENNFQPRYVIPLKARKIVSFLRQEVKKSDLVILAVDSDREGEAIAWHFVQSLGLNEIKNQKFHPPKFLPGQISKRLGAGEKKTWPGKQIKNYERIVFHEITKPAIEKALRNPRDINMNLVNAQQSRRILDRIVGYSLSPFLWKKISRGLSAGRVQSVAVRLVVEREKEIENFKPQEHWTIVATLLKIKNQNLKIKNKGFDAILVKKNGKIIPKLGIKTKKEADEIINDIEGAEYKVIKIIKKEIKRNPLPPFTTSALQQTAWQKFHWPAKFTMQLAQGLYEKGLITYHRSDSLNLSEQAIEKAKKFIEENYGPNYWPGFFRKYKTKIKGAQEAHEAIRPTSLNFIPQNLGGQAPSKDKNTEKLYDLIWRRFIACQMKEASFDSTMVEIETENSKSTYLFRVNGQVLKFDGFLRVYPLKFIEAELPNLAEKEILRLIKAFSSQHFTQPPPRYNEASLIKALEENGIGRPSTYAPILSTIQGRNYIIKDEQKRFQPTEIGLMTNNLLTAHFPSIVDIEFTAQMEEKLDEIAQGEKEWTSVIKEFYWPFEKNLQKKYQEISKKEIAEQKTEKKCPECKSELLIKFGRFGRFYACSSFPKCRYTASLKNTGLGIKCPKCQTGEIFEKKTKKQKIFYGCSDWPKCDFALWDKPSGEFCPKCKSLLIETKNKRLKCSNKECGAPR